AARLRDRAHRLWRTNASCDIRVARGLARGDFAQRFPHAPLERGAADVERKIEPDAWCVDEADDLCDEPFERRITTDERCVREPVLQITRERIGVVAEQDCAHPACALRDQNRTERALAHCEADFG